VSFEPNSAKLRPSAEGFLTNKFAEQLKAGLNRYHTKLENPHFTICLHPATTLQVTDGGTQLVQHYSGRQINKLLLEDRAELLQSKIEEMTVNAFADPKLAESTYHFPKPSPDVVDFHRDMPSGVVLVIAEDHLHQDDFQRGTEEEAKQHFRTNAQNTKCKAEDFKDLKVPESKSKKEQALANDEDPSAGASLSGIQRALAFDNFVREWTELSKKQKFDQIKEWKDASNEQEDRIVGGKNKQNLVGSSSKNGSRTGQDLVVLRQAHEWQRLWSDVFELEDALHDPDGEDEAVMTPHLAKIRQQVASMRARGIQQSATWEEPFKMLAA